MLLRALPLRTCPEADVRRALLAKRESCMECSVRDLTCLSECRVLASETTEEAIVVSGLRGLHDCVPKLRLLTTHERVAKPRRGAVVIGAGGRRRRSQRVVPKLRAPCCEASSVASKNQARLSRQCSGWESFGRHPKSRSHRERITVDAGPCTSFGRHAPGGRCAAESAHAPSQARCVFEEKARNTSG